MFRLPATLAARLAGQSGDGFTLHGGGGVYHLVVAGNQGALDGEPYELDLPRALREGTDEALTARYGGLSEREAAEILPFPAVFTTEGSRAEARLGFFTRVRRRGSRVRLEYAFYPDVPPISNSALARLAWDLDIGDRELTRTHWAMKAVTLMPVLVETGLLTDAQIAALPAHVAKAPRAGAQPPLIVTPTAFSLSSQERDPALVAVMMPFDARFTPVLTAIQAACADAGLQSRRVDDMWQESAIIQDIFNLLYRSAIVVVDFTGRNPNVMYETGIAHTLGRQVVPITQSMHDVPFDLRHHRVLKYLPNGEGLTAMQAALADRLRTLMSHSTVR